MRSVLTACGVALMAMVSPALAFAPPLPPMEASVPAQNGLSDATVLIVRHAEKPRHGTELSRAGKMRAEIYAGYFQHFTLDGHPVHIDSLVASTDTRKSSRPRLTLEPLSLDTGLAINQPCPDRAVDDLVDWVKQRPSHQVTLVSWHHTKMARLLTAFGADPAAFLPGGRWPDDAFDWVVALRFDHDGHLIPGASRLISEPAAVNEVVSSFTSDRARLAMESEAGE
jgi:hypothetical protein